MRNPISSSTRAIAAGLPAALALTVFASPAVAAEPPTASTGERGLALRFASGTDAASYAVQPGDTVSAIARAHGLRVGDVLAWNGLNWSSIIHPGDVLRLTAPSAQPAPAAPAVSPAARSYTIVSGDTVSSIARRHGVSTDAVLAANALTRSSIIYPGQTVVIPGQTSATPAAAPPVAAPVATGPSSGSYAVVSGDTISAIAGRHGVTTDALLAANSLTRSSIIYPGQTVSIPAAGAPASVDTVPASASTRSLDAEQTANAQVIVRVGRELGVPDRGIAIALATAMQESSLRNLDHGPDDSLGVFQQRPSTGWGTDAEVRDPDRAARAFFGGPADPNGSRTRGLLDIAGWESVGFAQAAQAVQVSAYPDRYGAWEQSAYAWLATLG